MGAGATPDVDGAPDPGLEAKVAFLSDPRSYPESHAAVTAVQTHMSWVFLTGQDAYKLKKPSRLNHHDLSTVAARHDHCLMEIGLNRRLSEGVYLGLVPLVVDAGARLRLGGAGTTVDWLVHMRRLPGERMLDRLIRNGTMQAGEVRPAVALLARYYRGCAPEAMSPAQLHARLTDGIADNARELLIPEGALPQPLIEDVRARQLEHLARCAVHLERRVAEGRIVEGHGDLRPEHICLEARPQIIDCLEFSRSLRIVDCAEEFGFLALECERLGAPQLKGEIFEAYGEFSGDRPPAELVDFYQSHHACVRAKIALWHLQDPSLPDRARWPVLAGTYLRLARDHLDARG
jgi:aminoglycoside phosphotransferase family enzyme